MRMENIGVEQGEHEVSPGLLADKILGVDKINNDAGHDFLLDQETGDMVTIEEFKKRREGRLETGREQQ